MTDETMTDETRVCAGISLDLSLSREEFTRLEAFAARKLAEAQEAVAALGLCR